jgi:DNA repair protein RadC
MNVTLTKAQQQARIKNGKALFQVMREILLRDAINDLVKEHLWVVGLAEDHTLQYVELVSLGSKRATVVEPMEVFRWALQKDSASIILVHNHPRGTLQPSTPDVELTAHMYQVGELLELPVVDHLIISPTAYYSFVDSGLMAEVQQTRKHLLSSAAQERLKAEAKAVGEKAGVAKGIKVGEAKGLKAGREAGTAEGRKAGLKEGEVKGREAEKLQVALAMKAKGIAAGVIAEVTGLSVAKVKGLKVPTRSRRSGV